MSIAADIDLTALKAVAEPLRLQILQLLAEEELCVCHLVEELAVDQPLVSHHLRVLREAGLVESERWRSWTYYRLAPEALEAWSRELGRLAEVAPSRDERRRPC